MRKTKAEAAESRKRILTTAAAIFLREGITATTISDVMAAAGLTQGGFYRHFKSKEHLVAEANAAAFDDIFAGFEAAASGLPPRGAIDAIVERYLFQLQGSEITRLCPLANLSSELRHADTEVKTVVLNGYARMVKFLASYLMRLDYTNYVGLAESIVSVMVGAVSIASVATDPKAAEAILLNAKNAIQVLLQNAATSASLTKPTH